MNKRRLLYFMISCFCVTNLFLGATSSATSKKVHLSKNKITLHTKKSYKLKLKGAKPKNVKWSSSNKKIATVKKGMVRAKKKGKCYVAAKYLGKKYRCSVVVKDLKKTTADPKATRKPSSSKESNRGVLSLKVTGVSGNTKVITYTVTNHSDKTESIPAFVSLDRYDGRDWQAVPRKNSMVTAQAMIVMSNREIKLDLDLNSHFTEVGSGKYRIGIQTSYGKIYAEFVIS